MAEGADLCLRSAEAELPPPHPDTPPPTPVQIQTGNTLSTPGNNNSTRFILRRPFFKAQMET